ncbi:T3SS effector HopA1 family protein [Nocardia sp. NPDC003963]
MISSGLAPTGNSTGLAAVLAERLTPVSNGAESVALRFDGAEIAGPVDLVTQRLAAVLYEALHARPGRRVAGEPADPMLAAVLADKPTHCSPMTTALVERFGDREFGVRRPVVADNGATVVYDYRGLLVRTPRQKISDWIGSEIETRVAHYSSSVSPGFFYIYGRGSLAGPDGSGLKKRRIYLALGDPSAARDLFIRTVGVLDDAGIDFEAKVFSDAPNYPRSDAIVLYLDETPDSLLGGLIGVAADFAGALTEKSMLTRSVSRGISLADEPVDPDPRRSAMSFGQHRCLMIAGAVLEHIRDGRELETALDASAAAFAVDPADFSRNLPQVRL